MKDAYNVLLYILRDNISFLYVVFVGVFFGGIELVVDNLVKGKALKVVCGKFGKSSFLNTDLAKKL